jgi:acetolactate synthase-1/2/3 large subunit
MTEGVTAFSHTLLSVDELPAVLGRAFAVFDSERPRPVHIELPLDIITAPAGHLLVQPRVTVARPTPSNTAIEEAAQLLKNAKRPLLLLGGGCINAQEEVRALASLLDAPTALTINAKGLLPPEHPLLIGSNHSFEPVRLIARDADVVLAIGTELGETDHDIVFDQNFQIGGQLIRIDIDAQQLFRNHIPTVAIKADARSAIKALLDVLPSREYYASTQGAQRASRVRESLSVELSCLSYFRELFNSILETLPNARFVGDSTQPVYSGNHIVDLDGTRRWFNSTTGFGTLGYGLPAAIGARLGDSTKPVICLIGDGGLQFTLPELASAVEAKVGIIILLWNNQGYEEIKRYMERRDITPIGVDIYTPDFITIARGFGCNAERAIDYEHLQELLKKAPSNKPLLIEILQTNPFHP